MDSATMLGEFRARLRALEDSLRGADPRHIVEVGSVLHTMTKEADDILNRIKDEVREVARGKQVGDEPGAVTVHGLTRPCTVTFAKPSLVWAKGADPEVLRNILGDRFDLFVETNTTYKPRDNADATIIKVASSDEKALLTTAITEKPNTPRVSFAKLP